MIPHHRAPPLPRLFLAVDLPNTARFALLSLTTIQIPKANIISDEDYHITLHFLGNTPPEPVLHVARRVTMPAFDVSLRSVAAFPNRDRPYTIFAHSHSDGLLQLRHRLAIALAEDGFHIDTRPYQPHVTLAKVSPRQTDSLSAARIFIDENARFNTDTFRVNEFVLMESVPSRRGPPRYVIRERFPLQQPAERMDTTL